MEYIINILEVELDFNKGVLDSIEKGIPYEMSKNTVQLIVKELEKVISYLEKQTND